MGRAGQTEAKRLCKQACQTIFTRKWMQEKLTEPREWGAAEQRSSWASGRLAIFHTIFTGKLQSKESLLRAAWQQFFILMRTQISRLTNGREEFFGSRLFMHWTHWKLEIGGIMLFRRCMRQAAGGGVAGSIKHIYMDMDQGDWMSRYSNVSLSTLSSASPSVRLFVLSSICYSVWFCVRLSFS